jgi:hypothetical protein
MELESEALSLDLIKANDIVGLMGRTKDQLAGLVALDHLWLLLVFLQVLVESANPLMTNMSSLDNPGLRCSYLLGERELVVCP